MFLLRDLPTPDFVRRFEAGYGAIDADAVCLFLTTLRCASDLLVDLDVLLGRYGLSHGRWIALVLLMREDDHGARPMDMARKQGVTRATMSGLLQGLGRDGLVVRRDEPQDGRGSRVVLTQAGCALLDKLMPDYYARVAKLNQGLDPQTVISARDVLQHMMARTGELSRSEEEDFSNDDTA